LPVSTCLTGKSFFIAILLLFYNFFHKNGAHLQ